MFLDRIRGVVVTFGAAIFVLLAGVFALLGLFLAVFEEDNIISRHVFQRKRCQIFLSPCVNFRSATFVPLLLIVLREDHAKAVALGLQYFAHLQAVVI
jgi:hypothetical protein